ncbi:MAG: hypothetical protein K9N52_11095 [Verrucomicrobia bacterium]|nr:hypothetical protein [Verrucomicrobiota bacterium]
MSYHCRLKYSLLLFSVLIGLSNVFAKADPLTQEQFNIVANSEEDQTAAVQSYMDAVAEQGGGEARLTAGAYTIKGSLTVPTGVTLAGTWETPHHGVLSKGTVIHAYGGRGNEDGPALIKLTQSSAVKGVTILYPEQELADLQPYPWAIHGSGMHCTVENVTLVNAWQGISMGPEWNELHLIRNVFGCVLRRGVKIDGCTDIGRIENVHFNPHYWPRSKHEGVSNDGNRDLSVAAEMQKRLEAFIFCRTDWEYVVDTFVFGAKIGYHFTANERGGACNGQFLGIGADMSQYGVVADRAQKWGILITNGEFVCGQLRPDQALKRSGILTTENFDGSLQLSNCSFWGFFTHILEENGSGFVSMNQITINNNTPGEPCVLVNGGRASISQSFFNTKGPHVRVNESVVKVGINNNFAPGGVKIENDAGDKVSTNGNE